MHTARSLPMMIAIFMLAFVIFFPCVGGTGALQENASAGPATKPSGLSISQEDPNERTVRGQAVDPNGQALAQIPVVTYGYHKRETVTGQDGRFSFKLPLKYQHVAGCLMVARDRKRNLAAFHGYVGQDMTVMKLEPAVLVAGTISDAQGKGISDANCVLFWRFPGAGVSYGKEETITPDNEGRFEIRAIPFEREYFVNVYAEGYGSARASFKTDEGKKRIQLAPLALQTADQSVGGKVVDPNGMPVVDVKVRAYGEGQPWCQARSNQQGRFLIKGVCPGTIEIRGERTQDQLVIYGSVEAQAGDLKVDLVLNERYRPDTQAVPKFESLAGKALPGITDLGIMEEQIDTTNKPILLCFFDMLQRPARRCVMQLAKQARRLQEQGLAVVVVQTARVEEKELREWRKKYDIPFPIAVVQGFEEKGRYTWGVKSLPWLILTDKEHVVFAEGFGLAELDAKIERAL